MTIYDVINADGFELCHPKRSEDFEMLNLTLNGMPRASTWQSPPMQLIRKDGRNKLAESDSPWLGSKSLIFRPNVVNAMGRLLREYGELLPLDCEGAELVVFNATRVLDALDEQASVVSRLPSGRIYLIDRYVFIPERIAGVDIFKLQHLRVSETFVSERFVQEWTKGGFHGLDFTEIWSG